MRKRYFVVLLCISSIALAACSSEEAPKETQQSQQQAQESAGKWTPEQKAAFEKAHERARKGEDDK